MDCGAVCIGHESGPSVLVRKNAGTAAADCGSYDSNSLPVGSSSYTVPAGTDIHLLDLY